MKLRLQRYMADCGIASRRACEQFIVEGRVRVNGEIKTAMPVIVDPATDVITIDEQVVTNKPGAGVKQVARGMQEQAKVYYLLNKPKGILVTNYDPAERKTVGELMVGVAERVFPVGRLDMDSRGALLMTNDGDLANRLTHPRHGVEKTYIVAVDGHMSPADLEKVKKGIWLGPQRAAQEGERLRGKKTERSRLKVVGREHGGASGRTLLEIKLAEGKNSEIRRVMARLGHPVRDLNRVAIGGKITIHNLEVGKFRRLTDEEVKWLFHASSTEYHERQRTATQTWYEQKEMEKEKKRLAKEGPTKATPKPAARRFTPPSRPAAAPGPFGKPRNFGQYGRPERGPMNRGPFTRRPSNRGPARPRPSAGGPKRSGRLPPPPATTRKSVPETRAIHPLGDQAKQDD